MELKEWAHFYVDLGWSIFPLNPKSKAPHTDLLRATGFTKEENGVVRATWEPFRGYRAPHDLIDVWWDKDPNANIALACGQMSGVTVIDIDVDKEEGWRDPYAIMAELGVTSMTSVSGSGGLHIFCKYVPGLKNSKKRVHPQVDIKTEGGYVVLPPSIHDKTGREYLFDPLMPCNKNNVEALAEFPEFLKHKIIERQENGNTKADWLHIFNGLKEKVDGRNNGGAELIGKCLHGLFMEFGADDDYLPFLWEFITWWNKRNQPPMSERELKLLFKSIVSRVL